MKLEFIITHYKEPWETVKRLLDSISLQQNIDLNKIGLIIVNDGSEVVFDKNNFKNYPFEINYQVKEWGDVAAARCYGQELATADYIMFCDCDDLLYRNDAIWEVFHLIDTQNPDIITSKFVEDIYNKNTKEYIWGYAEHNNDNVWIHGKIWKRQFLIDNDIKGCPELEHYYEDSYFVRQAFAFTNKIVHIDNPIWWWKYRINSCVRTDYNWTLKTYTQKITSNEKLVEAFIQHNKLIEAANYTFVQIYEAYFTLLEDIWETPEYKQYKAPIEIRIKQYIESKGYLLEQVTYENARIMLDVLRDRFYKQKKRLSIEKITFQNWFDNIMGINYN